MESSKLAIMDHAERRVDLFYHFNDIAIKISSWHGTQEVLIFKQQGEEWNYLQAAESLYVALSYINKMYKSSV